MKIRGREGGREGGGGGGAAEAAEGENAAEPPASPGPLDDVDVAVVEGRLGRGLLGQHGGDAEGRGHHDARAGLVRKVGEERQLLGAQRACGCSVTGERAERGEKKGPRSIEDEIRRAPVPTTAFIPNATACLTES